MCRVRAGGGRGVRRVQDRLRPRPVGGRKRAWPSQTFVMLEIARTIETDSDLVKKTAFGGSSRPCWRKLKGKRLARLAEGLGGDKVDRHELRHAELGHGHAEQAAHAAHGDRVVGYHDESGLGQA